MKLENEVSPDKDSVHKYGYVEGGDGKLYRVARGGLNERGMRLDDLLDEVKELATKEGGDRSETYRVAEEFFVTALAPFYTAQHVHELLESGCFVWGDIPKLASVIGGDDVIESLKKKDS